MTAQRLLTTHAGSLPRPKTLVHLLAAQASGEEINPAALAKEVEAATAHVIAKQVESGVDIINDGEVGRESFFTYVRHRMTGFGGQGQRRAMRDILMYPSFLEYLLRIRAANESVSLLAPPAAVGEVKYKDTAAIDAECARLRSHLDASGKKPAGAFMTAPSPGIIAAAMENKHYDSLDAYVEAVGKALSVEYRAIVDAGFDLQIDAPDLAMERHTLFADKPLGDFLTFARSVVEAINNATRGLAGERIRLHVCWGNYNGPHECDEPIANIWPAIEKANVGGFVISLANPRHEHEIGFFKGNVLPKRAKLVAGAIDTTSNYVEHPEVVAGRLQRAVDAVGDPSRVLAGTDCGFETSAGYVMIPEDVVWAKLRALRDGAALASQRVFGAAA